MGNRETQRESLRRITSFRRISASWGGLVLLFFPAVAMLVLLIQLAASASWPALPVLESIATQPLQLLMLPLVALQVLIVGPLLEEAGWRGFVPDELQKRWNTLAPSLTLGLAWALWHLPSVFFAWSVSHTRGVGYCIAACQQALADAAAKAEAGGSGWARQRNTLWEAAPRGA